MVQRQSSRPTRLEDVAEAAGVHVSTVSRVLNGRAAAAVRPETRERIEEAATRLRYRPNAIARGLKLASAGALGLLVPSLRNPVYSAIIRGAFDRAWERSFVVLLAEDLGAPSAQQAYERLVEEGRIDGLLIASARPGSPLFDHLVVRSRSPASSSTAATGAAAATRRCARRTPGRLAAEHLLGLGHTRLAHISGPRRARHRAPPRRGVRRSAVRAAGHRCSVVAAPFERARRDGGDAGAARPARAADRRLRLEHQPGSRRDRRRPPGRQRRSRARSVARRLRRRSALRVPRGAADRDPDAAVGAGPGGGRRADRPGRGRRTAGHRRRDRARSSSCAARPPRRRRR